VRLSDAAQHQAAYQTFGEFASVPFWPGSLTILAAPPGAGKTSWALRMVADAAAQGFPAVIGCYEHTEEELADRLRRQAAGIVFGPHPEDENDRFDPRVENLLAQAGNAVLLHLNGAMDTIRVFEDRLLVDEGFSSGQPALIVLDYLQRAPVVNRMGQAITDNTRAGEAAVALKQMALRHGWAVVAISALEKGAFIPLEQLQANPEVALATLLGDERLPYEADRVFVVYKEQELSCGCCHRLIRLTAKNRLGSTGAQQMVFWGQRTLPLLKEEASSHG